MNYLRFTLLFGLIVALRTTAKGIAGEEYEADNVADNEVAYSSDNSAATWTLDLVPYVNQIFPNNAYSTLPSGSNSTNNTNFYGSAGGGASSLYPYVPSTTETIPIRTSSPAPPTNTSTQAPLTVTVGILFGVTGVVSTQNAPNRDAVLFAINQINLNDGILGRQLKPFIVNLGNNAADFANTSAQIVAASPAVVFGVTRASARRVASPIFTAANVLLFSPDQAESFEFNRDTFFDTSLPNQQILPAVDYVVKRLSKRRWFFVILAGPPNTVLPQIWVAIIKAQLLSEFGLTSVGEIVVTAAQTNFSSVFQAIRATQPDVVFSTILGDQNVPFVRQLKQSGLIDEVDPPGKRSRYEPYNVRNSACAGRHIVVLSPAIDENLVASIGAENATGIYTTSAYYQTTDTRANAVFLANFMHEYPQDRHAGDVTQSGYALVYLWKEMVERAQTFATDAVRAAGEAGGIAFDAPEGRIEIDGASHFASKHNRIGCVAADGLIDGIIGTVNAIKPDPYLRTAPFTPAVKASLANQIAVIMVYGSSN